MAPVPVTTRQPPVAEAKASHSAARISADSAPRRPGCSMRSSVTPSAGRSVTSRPGALTREPATHREYVALRRTRKRRRSRRPSGAQALLDDLPHRVARQLVEEVHLPRALVGRERLRHVVDEYLGVLLGAVLGD